MSARKAAKEQVKAARQRARDIRRQARTHRIRATAERQPSLMLTAIGLVVMLGVGSVIAGLVLGRSGRTVAMHRAEVSASADASRQTSDPGVPIVLINGASDPGSPAALSSLARITDKYRNRGYDVVTTDAVADGAEFPLLLAEWHRTKDRDDDAHEMVDRALEIALQNSDLYGLLHVSGSSDASLRGSLIWSEVEGAENRRHQRMLEAPGTDLPYLLINDHPTKHDPAVSASVERILDRFETAGWEVDADDVLEARVRGALPPGRIEPDTQMPDVLQAVFAESGLGGIIYVYAPPGDAPVQERVRLHTIEADFDLGGDLRGDRGVGHDPAAGGI